MIRRLAGQSLAWLKRSGGTMTGNLEMAAGKTITWLSGTAAGIITTAIADGALKVTNAAGTSGCCLSSNVDGGLTVRTRPNDAYGSLYAGGVTGYTWCSGGTMDITTAAGLLRFWGGSAYDAAVKRIAAGVVGLTNASTGWAALQLGEMAADPDAAADAGRLFVKDNGSGKSQLCVRFGTGAVQVIATEP